MAKSNVPKPEWIRPLVHNMHPYTPGEQPKVKGLIKLNTNENPYPPSPKVMKAVREAVDGRFRLYPNPTSQMLREKLAQLHGVDAAQVMIGNGSDELLALATRAFVEPSSGKRGVTSNRSVIQYWTPSYSLYPVLADIHGACKNEVPLSADFKMPSVSKLKNEGKWNFQAALTYVTTPNAPTGRGYSNKELLALCRAQDGIVILDEAYVDFAEENAMSLLQKCPNVLISRTFSKAYSLCYQRVGYFVGHPHLIRALDSIRDSYNVNGIGQVAALATLQHLSYYRSNFKKIIRIREEVGLELDRLGFDVLPSQTNFLFVRPPGPVAGHWYEGLRKKKILVRWFGKSAYNDRLRMTIGSQDEMSRCVEAIRKMMP